MLVVAAKTKGLFEEEVDDLMAVARAVRLAGDVDPVFAMGMLEDELVEVGMVLQEIKPSVGNGHVGMREVVAPIDIRGSGQAYVAGFAGHVLAVLHSTDGFIQGRTTES